MGGRMILAALLGGLALFLWGFAYHAMSGMGHSPLHQLASGEAEIGALLTQGAPEPGMYAVPGMADVVAGKEGAEDAWSAKAKAGPNALILVQPQSYDWDAEMPMQLAREFAVCVGLALLATFLITVAGGLSGAVARIVFCVLMSLFGLLQSDLRFWNWYRFPDDWTLSQFLDKVVGGIVLGIVLHLVLRKR